MAARQDGVIALAQLLACGLTYGQVRVMVEKGHLHPLHRGLYAVGTPRVGRQGHLRAALLACGPDAFLSHRTAAGLARLRALNIWRIEVTVPGCGRLHRPKLIVHRTRARPHPDETRLIQGLRVSSVPRLFVELAPSETRAELDRMIELAIRRGALRIDELEAAIERHARRPGLGRLKAAAAAYRPRPFDKSGLERVVAGAIGDDERIPPPQRNVHVSAGGINWEIDFWWERERVALEVDGHQYHLTPDDLEKDRFKDAKLMAIGVTPLRVTDKRWEVDAEGALSDLRAVLQRRAT